MTDYPELYKRLAQEIIRHDGKLTADTRAFVRQLLLKLRAEGYKLTGDAEAVLTAHLDGIDGVVKSAVAQALDVTAEAKAMQSEAVLKLAEQAFSERWPDGLDLSDRLWRWQKDTRDGVLAQLQAGIRQGKAANAVIYDMQRAVERTTGGNRFKIVSSHSDQWVEELHQSAHAMIHDAYTQADWQKVVGDVEARISEMSRTGSRSAAERLLDQMKRAVAKGSEELADKAVKWWVYDKQLYHLRRIARTEMATAAHRAVIASAVDDATVIGFQWRLSASHDRPDICDYYANIEMGLGKGVWTKEAVPHHKAHPHCMCLLIPRVTRIAQAGSTNYAEFIRNSPPDRRERLLPGWAKNLNALGMPLDKLIRADGLGLVTREALKGQMGEERFNAVNAIAHAAGSKDFGLKDLTTHKRKTARLLADLEPLRGHRDVDQFVRQVLDAPKHVDSRMQHYIQRRYQDRVWNGSLSEMDAMFRRIVTDQNGAIYRSGPRYQIRSTAAQWIAIIEPSGKRVSLFPDRNDDLGEPLWTLKSLLD